MSAEGCFTLGLGARQDDPGFLRAGSPSLQAPASRPALPISQESLRRPVIHLVPLSGREPAQPGCLSFSRGLIGVLGLGRPLPGFTCLIFRNPMEPRPDAFRGIRSE